MIKKKLQFAIIAFAMILTQSVFSQTKTITGTVLDNTGSPLPGANVVVEGTKNGTATDFDGKYTLKNVSIGENIVYTFLGMVDKTIKVGSQSIINVSLGENAEKLKEVVVVAYGTQKRSNITGAVSIVGAKEIGMLPVANAAQALQGRAAGVSVTNSGTPGTDPVVLIRGLGTFGDAKPLYVIDGVITGGLGGISPSDIENITVLKDASTTALYGARGSNGVIMVTTKKGKKGAGEFSFNNYTGVQFFNKRYNTMNTRQYLDFAYNNLGIDLEGRNPPTVPPAVLRPKEIFNNNVNYQDAIFTSGIIKDYNLSYASGNEKGTQRFSAEYLGQEGIIINTGFERYSVRGNTAYTFGKFSVGNSLAVAFGRQKPELNAGNRTLIEHAIKAAPYLPIYNPDNLGGFQGPSGLDGQDAENPVRIQTLGNASNSTVSIIGNIYAELELCKGLKFKSMVGIDYYTGNYKRFSPSYKDGTAHQQPYAAITNNTNVGQALLFNNSLIYKKTVGEKHNFELLALAENTTNTSEYINANSRNPETDVVPNLTNTLSSIDNKAFKTIRTGYVGRLNYDYDNKYLLALSIRRDASSRFGRNFRWATFPTVALGWNIAKEKFMENTAINNLKLRGSYGIVGNDQIGDYLYNPSLVVGFIYPVNDAVANGITAGKIANPKLKWEEKTMQNLGLDLGLFNNKVTATIEVFNNTSNDLLFNRPIPISIGAVDDNQFGNVGSATAKGIEFNLGYNDTEGDFTWSANFNIGKSKTELITLADAVPDYAPNSPLKQTSQNISNLKPGEPLFYYYGLVTDGIYQNQAEVNAVIKPTTDPITGQPIIQTAVRPGDIRYKDLNGDGKIDAKDRTNIGNPYPDFTYGFNFNAGYKNFDINLFVSGVQGAKVFNANRYDLYGQNRLFNGDVALLNSAIVTGTGVNQVVTNPSATIPRVKGASDQNLLVSDRFVEDGSYARLKNLTIGYTLPNKAALNKYFSKFRIYVSAQNLVTLTKYSGLDPEIGGGNQLTGDPNSRNQEQGIDRGNYPQPKSVLMGLEITF
jgi:TonB-dependent starch-binding outer membrane protein SusC